MKINKYKIATVILAIMFIVVSLAFMNENDKLYDAECEINSLKYKLFENEERNEKLLDSYVELIVENKRLQVELSK